MRVEIIVVSDRSYRKEREDLTGPALIKLLPDYGFSLSGYRIVPDEKDIISDTLISVADSDSADLILTAGGTGFAERDVTPEATMAVAERYVPGIAEAIRAESMRKTAHAMLSRGIAVIRKKALIVNLPGSPRGAAESFKVFASAVGHGIAILKGETPDG